MSWIMIDGDMLLLHCVLLGKFKRKLFVTACSEEEDAADMQQKYAGSKSVQKDCC